VTVSVGGVAQNTPPEIGDDTANIMTGNQLVLSYETLLSNDSDVDGDILTVTDVSEASNGTVQLVSVDNAVRFTPAPGFVGNAGLVSITVDPSQPDPNTPPQVGEDVASVITGNQLVLSNDALLSNDSDIDGDTLTIIAVSEPTNGTVELLQTDNVVRFTPASGFVGNANFRYTVSDGTDVSIGLVSITVNPSQSGPNSPPQAFDDVVNTSLNTPIVIAVADILSNDVDVNGDMLNILLVDDWVNGNVLYDQTAQTITFTPNNGFVGNGQFTYTVSDGNDGGDYALMSWGSVTVIVEATPSTLTAVNDQFDALEDTPLLITSTALLANDLNPSGDALTIVSTRNINGGVALFDSATQTINFVSGTGFTGNASFEYTISDGRDQSSALANINIAAAFELLVNNGAGDGLYTPGTVVTITAEQAPDDQVFAAWVGDVATVSNVNSVATSLVMPAADTQINASYTLQSVDTQPPSVPAGLTVSEVGARSVRLRWEPATDNASVTGYRVYIDGIEIVEIVNTSYVIAGLTAATNYQLTVSAGDAAANWSAQSTALTVQTMAPSSTNLKTYFFGHSLVNHSIPILPTNSNETSIPHWLALLSVEAGYGFTADGQYGFLGNHAQLPPIDQWGFDMVASGWNGSFIDSNFGAVILTAANFIQYQPATEPYYGSTVTPLDHTLAIVDYVRQQAPDAAFYIYENWPDMGGFANPFPPTEQSLQGYHDYTQNGFHDWWLDYQDLVNAARPNANVKMMPVGPILAKLLTDTNLLLRNIPVTDLYEDDAPHGRPTIYLLAALVHYMVLHQELAPQTYVIPDTIHPIVRDQYSQIIDYIWNELQLFTDDNGNSRIW